MIDQILEKITVPVGLMIGATTVGIFFLVKSMIGGKQKPLLHKEESRPFKLIGIHKLTTGVQNPVTRFRFSTGDANRSLGLPAGLHIKLEAQVDGNNIVRSYTPTSTVDTKGHFDVVVKIYEKGAMSQHLDGMKVNDTINIRGPFGLHEYKPTPKVKSLGFIAGGTGLTPCLQVIQEVCKNDNDTTKCSLIYANVTREDIIVKEFIDELAAKYPHKFNVHYVLDKPPTGWTGSAGFVTPEIIKAHLPAPAPGVKVGMCGPPIMLKIMKKHLETLGYKRGTYYSY